MQVTKLDTKSNGSSPTYISINVGYTLTYNLLCNNPGWSIESARIYCIDNYKITRAEFDTIFRDYLNSKG